MSTGDPDPKWLNENTCGKFRMFKPKKFEEPKTDNKELLFIIRQLGNIIICIDTLSKKIGKIEEKLVQEFEKFGSPTLQKNAKNKQR